MKKHLSVLSILLASALGACLPDESTNTGGCITLNTTVTATKGDTITTATGLRYIDTRVGTGTQALSCHIVQVKYVGSLTNGTVFDQGTIPPFLLGAGTLIPGFEQGVVGMKEGGTRRLIIPPSLGYGSQPNGSIPGNSTLIFDIELQSVRAR